MEFHTARALYERAVAEGKGLTMTLENGVTLTGTPCSITFDPFARCHLMHLSEGGAPVRRIRDLRIG